MDFFEDCQTLYNEEMNIEMNEATSASKRRVEVEENSAEPDRYETRHKVIRNSDSMEDTNSNLSSQDGTASEPYMWSESKWILRE